MIKNLSLYQSRASARSASASGLTISDPFTAYPLKPGLELLPGGARLGIVAIRIEATLQILLLSLGQRDGLGDADPYHNLVATGLGQ